MAHTTIADNGNVVYRTKLMELNNAAAFARMVGANDTRFGGVSIVPSTGKTARFFVQFYPVSAARQGAIFAAEYAKNAARAEAEGGDYIYWLDPDNAQRVWVFNPSSGETYPVDKGCCGCPQKMYRCSKAGLHCKHEIEFDNRRRVGVDPFARA